MSANDPKRTFGVRPVAAPGASRPPRSGLSTATLQHNKSIVLQFLVGLNQRGESNHVRYRDDASQSAKKGQEERVTARPHPE